MKKVSRRSSPFSCKCVVIQPFFNHASAIVNHAWCIWVESRSEWKEISFVLSYRHFLPNMVLVKIINHSNVYCSFVKIILFDEFTYTTQWYKLITSNVWFMRWFSILCIKFIRNHTETHMTLITSRWIWAYTFWMQQNSTNVSKLLS